MTATRLSHLPSSFPNGPGVLSASIQFIRKPGGKTRPAVSRIPLVPILASPASRLFALRRAEYPFSPLLPGPSPILCGSYVPVPVAAVGPRGRFPRPRSRGSAARLPPSVAPSVLGSFLAPFLLRVCSSPPLLLPRAFPAPRADLPSSFHLFCSVPPSSSPLSLPSR